MLTLFVLTFNGPGVPRAWSKVVGKAIMGVLPSGRPRCGTATTVLRHLTGTPGKCFSPFTSPPTLELRLQYRGVDIDFPKTRFSADFFDGAHNASVCCVRSHRSTLISVFSLVAWWFVCDDPPHR